jgi:hypothetical protein
MLRREAVLFLQEIINCCRDATLVNFVVLKRITKEPGSEADNFELHFKADVSEGTRNIIESVAEKYQLSTMQAGKHVIVYSPEKQPLPLTA